MRQSASKAIMLVVAGAAVLALLLGALLPDRAVEAVSLTPPSDTTLNAGQKLMLNDESVSVTFVSVSAGFRNELGRAVPNPADPDYVAQTLYFVCQAPTPPGTTVAAGIFTGEEELVLYLKTSDSPSRTWFSGPGERNSDGRAHAKMTQLNATTVRVGWEDQNNLGDRDFNDCVVDVVVSPLPTVTATQLPPSPTPTATTVPTATLAFTLTAGAPEIGAGAATVPIQNIPPDAFWSTVPDEPGNTGASKFGSIKFGSIKFGSIDVEASKFGSITLQDLKFGSIKFGSIDLAAAKFGSIVLSDIQLDRDGGWAALLQGTPYQDVPLQTLTLEDVIDLPQVQALTLAEVGLEDTLLRGLSVQALALGEFSIADLPLNDAVAAGTDTDRLNVWCATIGSTACASMGINPADPATAENITPLTLNIAGISLESVDLSAIKFGSIDLASTKFGSIKFGSIKFGSIDLESTKFGSIKFGSIKFGSINLAATKFGSIKFGSIDMRGTKFGSIKFGSIPVASRGLILDCALVDCTNDQLTLADAALVGALRGTLADIINLSDVSPEISDLTLADLFALVGIVSDLDALTIAEFFELSDVLEIYNLTLEDLLPLLFDPSDLPWEIIDLDATSLQNVAAPLEPTLTFFGDVNVGGVAANTLEVRMTLPDGFVFVPTTASFDGNPISDPALIDGVLVFTFTDVPVGNHDLEVDTRAGLVLGPATASAEATMTSGPQMVTASDSATVAVVESFELGNTPADVRSFDIDLLFIAHVSDAFDRDLYQFTITEAQAATGASADIYLSNLFVDYDLVLYGPPLEPLRGTPVRRINGLDDQGIDSSPADDVVAPDALDDLLIAPPAGSELHSVAANRQAFDENLRTGALRAGTYYLQIAGYNGAFDSRPYTLRVRLQTSPTAASCPPRTFPFALPGVETVPDPGSYPADLKTLFLVAPRQMEAWYGAALAGDVLAGVQAVAAHQAVIGGILPVDSAAAAAYDSWNAAPCSVEASNDVVRAIGAAIDQVRAARPSLEHIIIVGDHAAIPPAALIDGVTLSNQTSFAGEVGRNNEIGSAFNAGRYLSDDPYASPGGVAIYNHEVFFPDLALGRLVGTPQIIGDQLQRFIDFDGQLDPSTASAPLLGLDALITGYDFLTDGATAIADSYAQAGAPVDTLINEQWTADDLRSRLLGIARPDVASVNAHFDPWRLLPADQNAAGTLQNLFTTADVAGTGVLGNAFFYTMGCNSGVSLSDVAIGFPTQDWAETFAAEGALFAGNGGFGYGDTELAALSERFYGLLSQQIVDALVADGRVEMGRAWMLAKQQYQSEVAVWTPYDEKALQEATFYGLTMWRLGDGSVDVDGAPAGATLESAGSTPPSDTQTVDVTVEGDGVPPEASDPATLERFDTADGSYWATAPDGDAIEAMYRPIQPQISREVGAGDVRGALLTGLTSYDIAGWEPRYFLPMPAAGTPDAPIDAVGDSIFPATLAQLNEHEAADGQAQHRLLLSAGQFRPTGPGVGTQRIFTNMDVQLVGPAPGADLTDTTPPTVRRSNGAVVGSSVAFAVDVDPDATFVSVLYKRADLDGTWVHLPLAETGVAPDGAARWTGGDVTGVTNVAFEFLVQTHDAAGNAGSSNNKASNFLASPPSGATELAVVLTGSQQAGWFLGSASAEIIGSEGASITYSLDGAAFTAYDGPLSITGDGIHTLVAQDDAGGTAQVTVPIDTIAPLVNATLNPPANTSGVSFAPVDVDINAIDPGGSGVQSLTFESTGADPMGATTLNGRTATLTLHLLGTTVVTFSALDAAGNISGSGTITVQLEADPDVDRDGVLTVQDNCPVDFNPLQQNDDPERRPNGPLVPGDDDTWVNHDVIGNACDPDDDNDGLLDSDETSGALCSGRATSPLMLDSDGDHLADGWECLSGSNPNDASSKVLGGSAVLDLDGDRVPDVWERRGYNGSPNTTDTDGDGCHDLVEISSVDGDRVITDEGNRVIGDSDRLSVARRALRIWAPDPVQDYVLDIDKNGFVGDVDRLFLARAALLPDWLPKSCP